jgi:hypothetical protein
MELKLPLDQMTVEEKLRAIEEIWQDLSRNPEDVPSPEWHRDVLREREERLRSGLTEFIDLDELKKRFRPE